MIGHRTAVGLSLLCALLFSAIAVQSASALKAENTTAFTCVKDAGAEDFSDAHCDNKVTSGSGDFGHQSIPTNFTTPIEVDDTTTGGGFDPAVLLSKAFGATTEITCTKTVGNGELHNVETSGNHTITGTVSVKYTECSVQKPAKCDVEEPIKVSANFEGFEEAGNMGVEFKPPEGETFVSITYIDNGAEQCSLDGKSIKLTGSAVATAAGAASNAKHTGATPDFDHAKLTGRKTLLLGGVAAGFESTGTVRRTGDNPIALTTTT